MESYNCASSQIHMYVLNSTISRLDKRDFNNAKSCYTCLARMSDSKLECGHTICSICIQIFGVKSIFGRYSYTLKDCLLCRSNTGGFILTLKPPTAGVRILSIDGGGVRGVIPIKALIGLEDMIERLINCKFPIQQNFDLALGTSSGTYVLFNYN